MSLNEQLNNFKKQQVKNQSMLSSIASSRAAHQSSSSSRRPVPAATSQKPPADGASLVKKFSDDTKRLQLINSIRNYPVGAQMKLVIDLLRDTRQAFTPEQINEACYVDMLANKAVFDSMRNNSKAHYDGRRLSQHIWLLSNSQEEIAYPNDFKCDIKVDDEFKAMFRDMEVPDDFLEVEKELRKNGFKPATDTAARRAAEEKHGVLMTKLKDKKKKKKQEISKRTKLTNEHLVLDHPELFNR
ncbi:hypothetical protein EUTSA_v10026795mg [Eutrema salsugineum]|uniref:Transcription initiation factor IIE subunit beta n=1 Tax=Eutrema salsugineum TaxID=72664 RepID=V4LXB8_EUTSA|nr:hypothetical protein EUTSA_v10026795mg [Eutrema salsugineum]